MPAFAQKKENEFIKQWITKNAKTLHLSDIDLSELLITNNYTTANKLTFVYAQQIYKGLKVHNAVYSICLNSDGTLLSNKSNFVAGIEKKTTVATPSITAADAVTKAAAYLTLSNPVDLKIVPDINNTNKYIVFSPAGIAKQNIIASLMWASVDDGNAVKLVWNITIDVLNSADFMNVRVDAVTGNIIDADNSTVYENNAEKKTNVQQPVSNKQTEEITIENTNQPNAVANAAYYVLPFPLEAPTFGSLTTVNNPWLNAGVSNPVTVFGWHSDGTNEYNYTRGNNVAAYDDRANTNAPGRYDTSSTASPNFTFSKVPNFTLPPTVTNNMRAATTNLFYATNIIHDITYQYGFDEASGNFQVNNNSRGGVGNDALKAQAQDGGGSNNANMSTQPDGQAPTMQMYLWSGSSSLTVNSPVIIAGNYNSVEGGVSTNNILTTPLTGTAVYYNDDAGGTTHLACGAPANTLTGKIAFIDRGSCNFAPKIKNAQNAGAIAVVVINNVASAPFSMSGTDNTITIPAFMISQADGATIVPQISGGVSLTLNPSVALDGDYDNGIIAHEYMHGISNRLTGGAANTSCLANAEQGGEGWSDYLALMTTQDWSTTTLADSLMKRSIGTYVFNQNTTGSGIRNYPYSLSKTINPHTYADLNGTASGSEVHNIGEVWASALWDMTWRIIQQEGTIEPNIYNAASSGGNVIALNIVMTGLKLQVCSPGFIDSRNAILKADTILYNGSHACAIWNAFARRGMGLSASQGSSNSTSDQVVAFDLPSSNSIEQVASVDSTNSGNNITYTVSATCGCTVPANLKIVDSLPVGMNFISSSAGTANGNVVTIPLNFTQAQQTLSFTINAQVTSAGCNITYPINDNRNGSTIGGFTTAGGWAVSSAKSYSPASSWFASEPTTAANKTLTSSAITLTANAAVLSFRHYFNTETTFDGGVVEISTNAGSSWQDLGTKIIKGYYTGTMDASTTIAGRQAFTGYNGATFTHTLIDLSAYTGQSIMVRFRFTTDVGNSTTVEGWYVDDIKLINGCGVKNPTYIFNAVPAIINTGKTVAFIKSTAILPVLLKDFIINEVADQQKVKVYWNVENETNIGQYIIEHSADQHIWEPLYTITQTGMSSYNYFDNDPADGANYYRIKIIEKDGSFTYSAIRMINFNKRLKDFITLSPNPAHNYADIIFNTDALNTTINIFDGTGKLVMTKKTNGNTRVHTNTLSPGVYYVTATNEKGYMCNKKLIIIR
ncbi:M36 family metallopeptidase [Ferruginibacter lapsinanis]|uniref:M36 family metallopeptidase n=1 Tax=Ferruginibacter lapsinanis TaxID=563172 RepID=UPI001E2D77E5|nr:M36 family metallopeptidase [Ferruginibacter lapsinanis]UEG51275.1 M36 family metallopeptidase [Ferruginibacter lapsinanis]